MFKSVLKSDLKKAREAVTVKDALNVLGEMFKRHDGIFLFVAMALAIWDKKFSPHDFKVLRDECLSLFPTLFPTKATFEVFLNVGRGELPKEAVDLSLAHCHCDSYMNECIRFKKDKKLRKPQIRKAILEAFALRNPRPLRLLLGYGVSPEKGPMGGNPKAIRASKVVDVEVVDKVVYLVDSRDRRILLPDDDDLFGKIIDMVAAQYS